MNKLLCQLLAIGLLAAGVCLPSKAQAQISNMCSYKPVTTPLTGTECFPLNQNGVTKTVTTSSFLAGLSVQAIYSVANINALRALSITGRVVGSPVSVSYYTNPGDAPLAFYTLSNIPCSNGGFGDGGSQIPAVTSGYCWLMTPNPTLDVRNFGAKLDWNPATGTGTDNAAYFRNAIAYACTLGRTGYFQQTNLQLVQGGLPGAIASPIHIQNCPGLTWWANLHALNGAWDEGVTTTKSFAYVMPNQANPKVTVTGIWNPPNPWPQSFVSSVTNNGGAVQVNLASALSPAPSTGQFVQITGATGLTSINGTWTVTKVSASAYVLQGSTYAAGYTSGTALTQGALPVGMITIDGGSYAITLQSPVLDCGNLSGCVPLADYGILQGGSGDFSAYNVQIENFKHVGMFVAGSGVKSNICGGRIQQGQFSDITTRTGYPVYYSNAGDQQVGCLAELAYGFQNFYSDSEANDINYRGVHVYNGMSAAVGGPFYPTITGTFSGTGSFTASTVDNGSVVVDCGSAGTCPYVQISGNFTELFGAGIVDAPIVYKTSCATFACVQLQASNGIDPNQMASAQLFLTLGSWIYKPTITLEDGAGNINTSVWAYRSLDAASGINNSTPAQAKLIQNNSVGGSSFTTNAIPSNGSFSLSSVKIMPAPGATITDSGGCIPASAMLGAYNYQQGIGNFTPATAAATGACANDVFTIGGLAFHVATGSETGATATGSFTITGIPFPAIRKGMGISGVCIPSGSWVDGFNYYAQTIVIDNATHTAPSGCAGAETVTIAPMAYTFMPDDDGSLFTVVGVPAVTLSVPTLMPAGWNVELGLQVTTGVTLTPLGGSTVNGGTTAFTLNSANGNVVTPLVANGITSTGFTRYDIGNNGPQCTGGGIASSTTGSEATLAQCPIPANVLGLSGCIEMESLWSTTGGGNDQIIIRYGAQFAGGFYLNKTITSGGNLGYRSLRWICNAGATNVQTAIAGTDNDFGFLTSALLAGAIDTTAATNLFFNANTAGGDTTTLRHYSVRIVPQSGR